MKNSNFIAGALILVFLTPLAACQRSNRFYVPDPPILSPGLATVQVGSTERNDSPPGQNSVALKIGEIQGKQHRSPYDGQTVRNIQGIVTALRGDGFFLQDAEPDSDPSSSDGVFVKRLGKCSPEAGDLILLPDALVREFNPAGVGENSLTITNLVANTCEILKKSYGLPAPVMIGEGGRIPPNEIIENDTQGYVNRDNLYDPDEDGLDFYESLEGMLVQVNDAIAVSSKNAHRNVSVVGDNARHTNELSSEGVLVLREGDYNPERILLDDDFIVMPNILVGARFLEPIVGIIDYNFGEYNLEPIKPLVYARAAKPSPVPAFNLEPGQVSIATYNIENFDPAARPDRLTKFADHVVHKLGAPDILALQEVQDNDGIIDLAVTAADKTIKAMVEAIKRQGGPTYRWVNIDPLDNSDGGVPGGNIRSVVLYRSDKKIELQDFDPAESNQPLSIKKIDNRVHLSNNPARIGIGNRFFNDSRKPLLVKFSYQGSQFYLINAHLKSKTEDGPLYGEIQPPPLETQKQRNGQAELLAKTISQLTAIEPDAKIILLGDMNDFPWSEPLKTLEASGMVNLIYDLTENDRFTYIHAGSGQVLDHILVSRSLYDGVRGFKVIHINSVQLPTNQLSDHDPVICVIDFNMKQ